MLKEVFLKVSIIINNYNYGKYLAEAIDSALSQTYRDVEVVVVDDGSTDNSCEIIAAYGNRVIPIFQDNGGQASTFNVGFRAASGDLVHFLDADDRLKPEAAQIAVNAYLKSAYGVLQSNLQIIDANGVATGELFPNHPLVGDPVKQMCSSGIYSFPATSGNIFSAPILRRIFPIPEKPFRLCADSYLCILVPFLADRQINATAFAEYRIHGSNLYMHAPDQDAKNKQLRDVRVVKNALQKFQLVLKMSESMGLEVNRYFFCSHMSVIFRWIYCRRVYGECINEWPASDFQMLIFAAIAFTRGGRRRLFVNLTAFAKVVVLTVVPKSFWFNWYSSKFATSKGRN